MRLRLTKLDEFQFLTCFEHQLWGAKFARFNDWNIGDYLAFIVDKSMAGLAEVSGEPFVSKDRVWDNGIFPHRIPIKFVHAMVKENRPPILGEIRDVLTSAWGPTYGWGILNQHALADNAAETIVRAILSRHNDLDEIQAKLDQYLAEAKQERETGAKPKRRKDERKSKRAKSEKVEPQPVEGEASKEEESAHSKAQSYLIELGKITGCAVWIAPNDRNRQYRGKNLGEGCLKTLPSFGLSEEATKRISLIDVIWIRQNAPVCTFEVETTTSVYSGLLRMSDLLPVVPALNVKLFIVAPKERQDRVMAELARPTFRKIGLSDYCRFVSTESLEKLLSKVEGLEGHVQPTILDKIAIEQDDLESGLE